MSWNDYPTFVRNSIINNFKHISTQKYIKVHKMCFTHLVLLSCFNISTCTSSFLFEHNIRFWYSENKIHWQLLMKFIFEVKMQIQERQNKTKRRVEILKTQLNYDTIASTSVFMIISNLPNSYNKIKMCCNFTSIWRSSTSEQHKKFTYLFLYNITHFHLSCLCKLESYAKLWNSLWNSITEDHMHLVKR